MHKEVSSVEPSEDFKPVKGLYIWGGAELSLPSKIGGGCLVGSPVAADRSRHAEPQHGNRNINKGTVARPTVVRCNEAKGEGQKVVRRGEND